MSTTTTAFGPDFFKELIPWMIEQVGIGAAKAARMFWDAGMDYLLDHWIAVSAVLFLVLIYAIIRAFMGHWWILGSVLYNYFYFGVLFLIGLILGPEVFANYYFKLVLAVLYIVCFALVGKILNKTGFKRF